MILMMMQHTPNDSHGSPDVPATVQMKVTVERPSAEELSRCDRGEKFRMLLERNGQHRAELIEWIQEHGLSDQVTRIGEATAFNILFVEGTPEAAQSLWDAPGVVSVDVTDGFPLEPMQYKH